MDFLSNAATADHLPESRFLALLAVKISPEIGNKYRFIPHQHGAASELTCVI